MKNTQTEDVVSRPERETKLPDILNIFRLLRSASNALFAQADLHRQLIKVEWAEEKKRLSQILLASLLCFSFFICLVFFLGILVLAFSWDTQYRTISVVGICCVYSLCAYIAWNRLWRLVNRPEGFFASSREEFSADISMIRSKL